jgi:hypothetical protein
MGTAVDMGAVELPAAPTLKPAAYSTTAGATLTVNAAAGVLAGASRPASPLTALLSQGPANGVLKFAPDGSFTYTPTAGFDGVDSFEFTAALSIPQAPAATGKATITVAIGECLHEC